MTDQKKIFNQLKKLFKQHSSGLDVKKKYLDSKAKQQKSALHLYGKKELSIAGRKSQPTYLAGIIQQKNFVGFYFMPIYSHSKEFKIENKQLKKSLKGKSCFNLKELNAEMLLEIDKIIKRGKKLYKKEGWI